MVLRVARRAWHHGALIILTNIFAWPDQLDFWHRVDLSGYRHDQVGARHAAYQVSHKNGEELHQLVVLGTIESNYLVEDGVNSAFSAAIGPYTIRLVNCLGS